jgi:hypothetical protein
MDRGDRFYTRGERSGRIALASTGTGPERTLRFVHPAHGATKSRTRERLLDMAIGLAGSLLLTAFLSNVLQMDGKRLGSSQPLFCAHWLARRSRFRA